MKKLSTYIFLLTFYITFAATFLFAQDSYMIPDLGTPGMNTYVEIIAPHSQKGFFGPDSVYLNNPGDNIRLLADRADAPLEIGPFVVSWEGRMISAQIFVREGALPNDFDWQRLDARWKPNIQVVRNGSSIIEEYPFYIVQPWPLGNITGINETVLGAGRLGKRSPRGAMIVDSLILRANTTYTVSVTDCDPVAPGNQGYLPFILLSKGNIESAGSLLTLIDVSAPNNLGRGDAGPGGGGGGGSYHDRSFFSGENTGPRADGGSGFTGGGAGGQNRGGSASATQTYTTPGVGTGGTGAANPPSGAPALNGVPGGTVVDGIFENAGGGTGHPFGSSGSGSFDQSDCARPGGFGGGSGCSNNQAGAGGGFGTNGIATGGNNSGKAHGNRMLIPLAGGSGGASGNPNGGATVQRSGFGGGGGGAISLFGKRVERISVRARGGFADQSAVDVKGGHGSGGGIIVSAKDTLRNVLYDVTGQNRINGTPSGLGRGRQSAFGSMTVADQGFDTTKPYIGPVTDTTYLVRRRFPIAFTGAGSNGSEEATLDFYIKPEGRNRNWQLIRSVDQYTQGQRRVDTIDLGVFPEQDTIFYLTVVQRVRQLDWGNQNGNQYVHNPRAVLSQSAANILKVAVRPQLSVTKVLDTIRAVNCGNGITLIDTLKIRNGGNDTLKLTNWRFASNNRNQNPQLDLFPVPGLTVRTHYVLQSDSTRGEVRYTVSANTYGVINDTLLIDHNDPSLTSSTIRIPIAFIIDSVRTTFTADTITTRYKLRNDTLDVGSICVNTTVPLQIYVENRSSVGIAMLGLSRGTVQGSVRDNLSQATGTPLRTNPGDSIRLVGTITPTSLGEFLLPVVVDIDPCNRRDTIYIKGTAALVQLSIDSDRQHGNVRIGDSKILQYTIKNDGNTDAYITLPTLAPPFRYVPAIAPPIQIPPGTTYQFGIEFTPTDEVASTVPLPIRTAAIPGACPAEADILLAGAGVRTDLAVSKAELTYGELVRCFSAVDTVVLTNRGAIPITLTTAATIAGVDRADFEVLSPLPIPVGLTLNQGQSVAFIVRFQPTTTIAGLKSALLIIPTDDPAAEFVEIPLSARQAAFATATPTFVDFGTADVGSPNVNRVFTLQNPSGVPLQIRNISIAGMPEVQVNPASLVVPPGSSADITCTLSPERNGVLRGEIIITYENPCDDEQRIPTQYIGRSGAVTLQNFADFGRLPFCVDSTLRISLESIGAAPISLLAEPTVTGTDAALFSVATGVTTYPLLLDSGEIFVADVTYNTGGNRGNHNAVLTFRVVINGQEQLLTTTIQGNRTTIIVTSPDTDMLFGEVAINKNIVRSFTIANLSLTNTVRVRALAPNNGTHFSVSAIANPVIQPNGNATVAITFAPLQLGELTDSLVLEIEDGTCIERIPIYLAGIGLPGTEISVWLPDTLVPPTLLNLQIPVYARVLSTDDEVTDAGMNMEIRFDNTLFFPRKVLAANKQTAFQATSAVDAGERILRFRGEGINIRRETTIIAYIEGATLLGKAESTPLTISALTWDGGIPEVKEVTNGTLRIEICREGGDRLVEGQPGLKLRVAPNPATELIEGSVQNALKGTYTAKLISSDGRAVRSTEVVLNADGLPLHIPISVNDLATGMYRFVIVYPSGITESIPVVIVR